MRTILSFLNFFILSHLLLSQSAFSIKKAVVFKDGTVFLQKEADMNASGGEISISPLPIGMQSISTKGGTYQYINNGNENNTTPVLFGTVYWSAPGNEINEAIYLTEEKEEKRELSNIGELIKLNVDKPLCIWKNGSISSVCGIIVNKQGNLSNHLLLKEENVIHQIRIGEIARLEIMGDMTVESIITEEVSKLRLKLKRPELNQALGLSYLQKGITWLPNYHLKIRSNGKANLSLYANMLNDIESLEGVDVYFALGIPSFQFAHVSEPLFYHQSVASFLSTLNQVNNNTYSHMANVITSQRAAINYSNNEGSSSLSGMEEDFYLYPYQNVDLPKGASGHYKLLDASINYEDVYLVELGKVRANNYRNYQNEQENPVWHTLEFRNNTGKPLTTGSITFYNAKNTQLEPISQGQLDFVPPGKKASVKMNRVPDIWVSNQDKEINREVDANGYADLVSVEGKVRVANYKGKTITIKIQREVDGRLIKSSDKDWQTEESFNPGSNLNPISKAIWIIELKPGATEEIEYTYELYIN
ncbi:MAG: hypothetical protein MI974_11595 [Chitinophagales bacterium]|nr:hypothetical protein [Chitinophagales bacterium]